MSVTHDASREKSLSREINREDLDEDNIYKFLYLLKKEHQHK